jgi:hypothetical protein
MKKFFSWAWFFSIWITQIFVVLYVLDHLVGRTEHIIVSILGLMYVASRIFGMANAYFTFALHSITQAQFVHIRHILNDDPESIKETAAQIEQIQSIMHGSRVVMNYIFLGLISLICLLNLFSHL